MKYFNIDNLKEELANGDYEKVINKLLVITKNTFFHRNTIKISANYNTYKRNSNLGLYLYSESEVELNRLTDKIYNLLLKLEKYETIIISFKKHIYFLKLIILGVIIAIFSYLYIVFLHNGNFIFDRRDYHIYRTLRKSGFEFMIDNLNYDTKDGASWCYGNISKNCNKFGRLYNLQSAKKTCMELGKGWRLPTKQEINDIIGPFPQKYNVKSMLGGGRSEDGEYFYINEVGHFWTDDKSNKEYFWIMYVYGDREIIDWFDSGDQRHGYSCRCIRTLE